MYDRAQRTFDPKVGSTSANVGPGSYDADATSKAHLKSDGYAPFLSMTSRETFLNVSDQVVAAPGPGHYDPLAAQQYVKGGSTLATKEKRFKPMETETPGPGAYNVHTKEGMSLKIKSVDLGSGKLMTSRIKFRRKPEAPSIPSQGQAYGYEERDDGSLKKQNAPKKDNSIGPAFYNPAMPDAKATQLYRGVFFGKLSSKRTDFGGKGGPGPGDYDPFKNVGTRAENANIGHEEEVVAQRYETRIPRYNEAIVKDTEKKNIPGPGKYEIRGQFDPQPPKINTEGMEVEHPPFGSQAKRFTPVRNAVPPPGSYNDPRTALTTLKKVTGLKRSPFGQTSVRFQPEHHVKSTPGPGAYNNAGMGSESMRKAYLESTRKGVFGTTSTRTQAMMRRDDLELPGPAHYQVKEKPFLPRYTQPTANFTSVTNRLTEPPNIIKEIPPPGSYNVQQSYEKSQAHREVAKPRTDAANRKHTSFMSAATRFAPVGDNANYAVDPENPGPGTYEAKATLHDKGGLMVTRDKRFRYTVEDKPGPAAYELSPLVQDSVLKGTFNATLNNPIAPHMSSAHGIGTAKHAFLLGV
ncbi:sperm-tail PG-rich repeat-containing protein 2-like [Littorina saxatilis]|uniref:Sperm-tail PG-rich repeat-containing protein 2 n=1 Tax=Littorina saxatilis TaxID=31220 RepID=A0AAN9GMS7_9CAEN